MRNILWQIFFDKRENWERFVKKYGKRIRPVVYKEVEKFQHCGDPKPGFKLFVCEGCGDVKILAYRCRSRFCTSCSCGEAQEEKTETVSVEEFIGRLVQHIPEEHFKLIRHYGIYGRRNRSECKKILCQ